MNEFQRKRLEEKEVWNAAHNLLDLPSSKTREGHAEYMRAKRQVESKLKENPISFKEFLLHYDVTRKELARVLNLPMFGENAFRFRREKKS